MRYLDYDNGSTERIEGRAGVKLRLRRLRAEPLCRHCAERGKTVVATVVDHIIPLGDGGTDVDSNTQSLCDICHLIKTSAEGAVNQGASNHPGWLERSGVPLVIVCGPPCSGKTTYVKQHASAADTIIDLDSILMRLRPNYRHWMQAIDPLLFNQAIRARNALLGTLAHTTHGRAWFIVSAPTKGERAWWQTKLGGEVVLLHPGKDECKRRAIERGTPLAANGVDHWEAASKQPWSAPIKKAAKLKFGADGWPIEAKVPI